MKTAVALVRCTALVVAAVAPAHEAFADARPTDCYVACSTGAACGLTPADGKRPELDSINYRVVVSCEKRSVDKGEVLLRYRHAGQWFSPPKALGVNEALDKVFAQFPADPCSIPTPKCIAQRMKVKVAGIGGHGIDGQVSTPGGSGDPCSLALPCGRILPPAAAWRFRLEDPALNGRWRVQILRGTPPPGAPTQFDAALQAGVVSADGSLLAPGASYAYQLIDAAGAVRASGEFSLLSRPLVQTLHGFAAKRVAAGQGETTAWIDTLAANELDWDAYQLTLEAR